MDMWSHVDGVWREGKTEGAALQWFNLSGEGAELDRLAQHYKLHPLSIEDCHSSLLHTPKIDDFGDYLFLVLLSFVPGKDGPEPDELDVFLGRDFVITYQDRPEPQLAVTEVLGALRNGIGVRPGADGIVYEIADRLVDAILPQVNGLAERLDVIQDEIVTSQEAHPGENRAILSLRATAGRVRRLLSPQLLVMQRLSRGEFVVIEAANRIYFRDIYDHLVRTDLALEGLREDAEVALSTYLSALNNRISEVMKVLAVVGALALPASVIASIFGTNFDNVPGLHSNWGFVFMLVGMSGLAGGMAYYFKRKGWF